MKEIWLKLKLTVDRFQLRWRRTLVCLSEAQFVGVGILVGDGARPTTSEKSVVNRMGRFGRAQEKVKETRGNVLRGSE